MAAPTRLTIYNGALMVIKERFIATLTDNVESRRLLDYVWENDGVKHCLEDGQWFFAMRTARVDYDPAITPEFGYKRGFTKPADWVLTAAVCADEYFRVPLTAYTDESGYWYSDEDTIYVKYVSNDASYGGNMALWPSVFTEYVKAHFAWMVAGKLAGESAEAKALGIKGMRLLDAKNANALALPTRFPAQGAWTSSRRRYSTSRKDGGNGGSLIG